MEIIAIIFLVIIVIGWALIAISKPMTPPDPNCERCHGTGSFNYYGMNGDEVDAYCGCEDPEFKTDEHIK